MGYKVAIVGATGAVGEELLKILEQRSFPISELRLLASARSVGKRLEFAGEELEVEEARPESFAGIDIAFFSAGGSVSAKLAPEAVKRGTVVIDNTSHFRLDPDVPLVVPQINSDDLEGHRGIIANPNCSTIIIDLVLAPILKKAGIKRVVLATYQAVSGAGAKAMAELDRQVKDYVAGRTSEPQVLPFASAEKHYPIAFNLIPQIDVFREDDYTKEEWKMVKETRKVLHQPDLRITATAVRVPVFRCHSIAANVETVESLEVAELKELLASAPGVTVMDDPARQVYPMPTELSGRDDVYVGRIRKDNSTENGFNLWVVGDQIRKGAALNAVEIGEELDRRGLVRVG
ncbi:MAG: aspartate-semialdehyde dehydrogenase [Firmicutes bacterium]|nr:aspartate-semialdehyde dehydrogenase [Bacillota bacterium]